MTAHLAGWLVLATMGLVSIAPGLHRAVVTLFPRSPRTPSAPEAAR